MSNLTDFFPAAGGGGGLSVDPLDMRRYLYQPTTGITTKYGDYYNSTVNINSTEFWAVYEFNGGEWTSTVQNTYTNVIDITSSTNGGYLLNCIGRPVSPTQYCNFKITVDGKETIIPFDRTTGVNNYAGSIQAVLGNIAPGQPNIDPSSASIEARNMAQHGYVYDYHRSGSYSVNVNGFITNNRVNAYGVLPVRAMDNYHMGIRFNETLKVDIQTDLGNSGGKSARVGAQVQLR